VRCGNLATMAHVREVLALSARATSASVVPVVTDVAATPKSVRSGVGSATHEPSPAHRSSVVDDETWQDDLMDLPSAREDSDDDKGADGGGRTGVDDVAREDMAAAEVLLRKKRRAKGKREEGLFEYDDRSLPMGRLHKKVNDRLALATEELRVYEQRRVGVGKAISFISHLSEYVREACDLEDMNVRTKFNQDSLLDEHTSNRKLAEEKARSMESKLLEQEGTIKALRKRIFVLEKQHDVESVAFTSGFAVLGGELRAHEERIQAAVAAVTERQRALVRSTEHKVAQMLEAREAARQADLRVMPPQEYMAEEPMSQRGIKAYLLLHSALLASRRTVDEKTTAIARLKVEHMTQLARVQRKLQAANDENNDLRARLAAVGGSLRSK
jgi:hypothetical protein